MNILNSISSLQIKSLPLLFLFDSSIEDGLTKETIRFKILIASIVKVKLQSREIKLLLTYSLFIQPRRFHEFYVSFVLFEVIFLFHFSFFQDFSKYRRNCGHLRLRCHHCFRTHFLVHLLLLFWMCGTP